MKLSSSPTGASELVGETLLVCGFKKAWTEIAVYFDGAADYLGG